MDIDRMQRELVDLREFRKATEKRLYLLETAMKKASEPPETADPSLEPASAPAPELSPDVVEEDAATASGIDPKLSKDKPAK